ncbi:MAG TPA: hypothetical protein VLS89_15845 [Candidatus Nanopelagicales bacterium]|nr:hypothetical protein [Candidatus Nanopelagicales bacterium]
MAKGKTTLSKRPEPTPERLGPGLHLVHLDLGAAGATAVRTLDGRRLAAFVADEVDPALIAECRRAGRPMIACDAERGPTIVGALQTAPSVQRERDGTLVLSGKRVRVVAEQGVTLEAGAAAAMSLEASGKARVVGDRMVIDMSSNVRVLSALVELP